MLLHAEMLEEQTLGFKAEKSIKSGSAMIKFMSGAAGAEVRLSRGAVQMGVH